MSILQIDGVLDCAACLDQFDISRREFQRDLLKLREIGKKQGFSISHITHGRVFLSGSTRHVARLRTQNADVLATVGRIAGSLGGPIEYEMRAALGNAPFDLLRGFLHVRDATPIEDDRVDGTFAFLKDAAAGPARVEFRYKPARGPEAVRRVEPYHVVARSGRYYLVGYDLQRYDWRYFALDAMSGPMRKEGTYTPRPVPERFLIEQTVGWISGAGQRDVTFRLSSIVAAAVLSRTWQKSQQVTRLSGGEAEITIAFDDLGEAARWALGFGAEALIIAPPYAVAYAEELVERIQSAYAGIRGGSENVLTG